MKINNRKYGTQTPISMSVTLKELFSFILSFIGFVIGFYNYVILPDVKESKSELTIFKTEMRSEIKNINSTINNKIQNNVSENSKEIYYLKNKIVDLESRIKEN